jgi:hypothetical protein
MAGQGLTRAPTLEAKKQRFKLRRLKFANMTTLIEQVEGLKNLCAETVPRALERFGTRNFHQVREQ